MRIESSKDDNAFSSYPVAAGWVDNYIFCAIERPDGTIRDKCNGTFKNASEWIAYCNESLQEIEEMAEDIKELDEE